MSRAEKKEKQAKKIRDEELRNSVDSDDTKGITADKDEFSDWFTQIMLKADLADYSSVSGMMVFKPTAYSIWEKIKQEVDLRFKKLGIKNCYFPLFIPERTFQKLKEHTSDFSPEVAWVTHGGDTELNEKLAVRPTSETIMYESYSKWIRSWRDLPLKLNQWNNVVRWEFKHPVPFLRTREFLWNEGHTAYSNKQDAEKEGDNIMKIYKEICEKYLALPGLLGKKSKKETFPGADYTLSLEYFLSNGKSVQGPDFHHDGQHYAKAYDIKFLDRDEKEQFVFQNTFAISTRMLGVLFAIHSDKRGLILPPRIAPHQIIIIPILISGTKEKVITKAYEVADRLTKHNPLVDEREEYKPGYKFNEWELKGIPIRIEIGPDDLKKNSVVVYRRDTGKKVNMKVSDLVKKIPALLDEIQENLLKKAQQLLFDNIVEVENLEELKESVEEKKISLTPLCSSAECEDKLKFETGGAKVLNIPFSQPDLKNAKCVVCNKKAEYYAYVGKSY